MLHANLLSFLIAAGLLALGFAMRKRIFRNFDAFIQRIALLVFLGGFLVYFFGFRVGSESLGTHFSWFGSIFRPLLASAEMFAFKSNFIEVGEPCKESWLYVTCFSVVHFAAASVSFAVVINYLGVRFKSALRWRMLKWKKQFEGDIEIFFGINDVTLRLARDIINHHPKDIIIFFTAPEANAEQGALEFANIFNAFSIRREIIAEADRMHAIIRQVHVPIQNLEGNNVVEQLKLDDIICKTKEFVGFYTLNDDQLVNIAKSLKLRNDEFFKQHMDKKAYIFCRATSGKINGDTAFEYNAKTGVETVLVDSAQLAVKSMMCNTISHPVNFIDFDSATALATSTFHCMIIGFGETGQNIFKFIYEHGQFAYRDDFKGPRMVCHIVDPKANEKRSFFEMRYPCLKKENGFSSLNVEIQWHAHGAGDGRFWDLMGEIRDSLNYVTVATGSDNRNIAIAYDLCDSAIRWRKQRLKNFGIFVRSYHQINECRYDELEQVCHDHDGRQVVHTIGKLSESFTHKFVWKNYLEKGAAFFANSFEHSMGKPFDQVFKPDKTEAYNYWWNRHAAVKGEPFAYSNVKRIEYQEFSNAFHIYTKMHLLAIDNPDSAIGQENKRLIQNCKSLEDLEKLPFFQNLTKLEHLRYLASHEATGYTPMSLDEFHELGDSTECDVERHKLLNLVPWNELDSLPVVSKFMQKIPQNQRVHPYKYFLELLVQTSLAMGLHWQNKTSE